MKFITEDQLAAALAVTPILDWRTTDGVTEYAAAIFAALPADDGPFLWDCPNCGVTVQSAMKPPTLPDTGLDPERLARALKQIGQPNLIENAQWGYEALATSIAAEYARLTEKE